MSTHFSAKLAYLDLKLTDRRISFLRHTSERVCKARAAFWSIPNPTSLSMSMAIKRLRLKPAQIASDWIQITWKHLTPAQLVTQDKLKTDVHRSARNRLLLKLTNEKPLSADLAEKFSLPVTAVYREHFRTWEKRNAEIDPAFYVTPAMLTDSWKFPVYKNRHRLTRGAIHGFHTEPVINAF